VATNQEPAGDTKVLVPYAAGADVEPADAVAVVGTDEAGTADAAISAKPTDASLVVDACDQQAFLGTLTVS